MTITDKLEGLLPADGNYTTKDERVIAEAVKELRDWPVRRQPHWQSIALAFAAGCIASAIYVVLV